MSGDEFLVTLFMVASPLGATPHSTLAMSGDESLVTLFMVASLLRASFTAFYISVGIIVNLSRVISHARTCLFLFNMIMFLIHILLHD